MTLKYVIRYGILRPKILFLRSQNERHLCLVSHSFTKHSQNVCLINIHILIYWYAQHNCMLWKALWYYCVFLCIFLHFWRPFMCELLYLHQTFTGYVCRKKLICVLPIRAFVVSLFILLRLRMTCLTIRKPKTMDK